MARRLSHGRKAAPRKMTHARLSAAVRKLARAAERDIPLASEAPAEVRKREPVTAATKALLEAADEELSDARCVLTIMARSFEEDASEEQVVLERVLRMLCTVADSVEYASMGLPQKTELWPGIVEEAQS